MNIHLFLISFSYLYANYKYNCFEVPKDSPIRYFDGNIWRIMKPTRSNYTVGSRRPNISIDFDWDASVTAENLTSDIVETTTLPPATTVEDTTKRTAVKLKKKSTTKDIRKYSMDALRNNMLMPKKTIIIQKIKPTPKIKKKTVPYKCGACNITNKKTKKIIAKILKSAIMKTEKKPTALKAKKANAQIKKKNIAINIKTANPKKKQTKKNKLVWNALRTTKKPLVKTTPKSAMTTTASLPDQWISIIKDLVLALRTVEKKCNNTVCKIETSTPEISTEHNIIRSGRRAMTDSGLEDVLSLLINGIEIDESENLRNEELYDFWEKPEILLDFASYETLSTPKDKDLSDQKYELENILKESDKNFYLDALKPRSTKSYKDVFRQLHLNSKFVTYNDRQTIKNKPLFKTLKKSEEVTYTESSKYKYTTEISELLKKPHVMSFFEALRERYEAARKNNTKNRNIVIDLDTIGVNLQSRTKGSSQEKDIILDLDAISNQDKVVDKSISPEEDLPLDLDVTETNDTSVNNDNSQDKDKMLDLDNIEMDIEMDNETTEDIGETKSENASEDENNEIDLDELPQLIVDVESGTNENEAESDKSTENAVATNEIKIQNEINTEEPEIILEEDDPEHTITYVLDDGLH